MRRILKSEKQCHCQEIVGKILKYRKAAGEIWKKLTMVTEASVIRCNFFITCVATLE